MVYNYLELIMFKFNREIQKYTSNKAIEWINLPKFIDQCVNNKLPTIFGNNAYSDIDDTESNLS